jgi:phospholipid/cholesterol/gamma-HCH transport system permease protein
MPSQLSGGMARRVALARAIALDPMLVMYDEPFAGLDPISLGIVGQLIRKLNDALGITSVVVTHDVYESLKIVDYLYFVSEGRIVAQGTPEEVRASTDPFVRQFVDGQADGPVPFHVAAAPLEASVRGPCRASAIADGLRRIGGGTRRAIARLGFAARFAFAVLMHSPEGPEAHPAHAARDLLLGRAVARDHPGVGPVRRHGARAAGLRRAAALRRVRIARRPRLAVARRELGPVVAGLLFASRAGSAITAEIGLMKATEQLSAMEMMAVDPLARVVAPRFWGGVISMPLLAALFSTLGIYGAYLVGVKLIGIDAGAFWGNMQSVVDFRATSSTASSRASCSAHREPDRRVRGLRRAPTAEGVSGATTRTVVASSLAILAADFMLTVFMFRGVGVV